MHTSTLNVLIQAIFPHMRMVNISDDLHQLAVTVEGGSGPLLFLSRVARGPFAPWVPMPLSTYYTLEPQSALEAHRV